MSEKITVGRVEDIEPEGLFPKKTSIIISEHSDEQDTSDDSRGDTDQDEELDDEGYDDDSDDLDDDDAGEDDDERSDDDSGDDSWERERAQLMEQNRRLMQSINDKETRSAGVEAKLQKQINELENKFKEATDQSVVDGKDLDDYTKYGDLRALEQKMNDLSKQITHGVMQGGGTQNPPPSVDPEALWVDQQPDVREINEYINNNRAKISSDPQIMNAGGQKAQYYAVKSAMLEDKLSQQAGRDGTRKKSKNARKKAGKLPSTDGIGKRTGAKKMAKNHDALDKAFTLRHNRVIDL